MPESCCQAPKLMRSPCPTSLAHTTSLESSLQAHSLVSSCCLTARLMTIFTTPILSLLLLCSRHLALNEKIACSEKSPRILAT